MCLTRHARHGRGARRPPRPTAPHSLKEDTLIRSLLATTALALVLAATAPAATVLHRRPHRVPQWFRRQARCIAYQESRLHWHINDPPYGNGFQFTLSTWRRVGGLARNWVTASPREQIYRAWLVYRQDGDSWSEWPTSSRACRLS